MQHLGSARLRDSLDLPIAGLPQQVNDFLLSRSIENCSKQTLETYAKRLRAFFVVAGKADLRDVHKADIERWFLHLMETDSRRGGKRSPSYIVSCYRDLHAFFNWAFEEEIISMSPMKTIKKPKTPKVIKPFLSDQQFQKLLSVCNPKDYRGIRNRAWLSLLWTTGARFSELADLNVNDLDWNAGRIKVMGKGAKERYVPFANGNSKNKYEPYDAQKPVYRYLMVRPDLYSELWIGEEKRPMTHNGLMAVTRKLYARARVSQQDMHHIFRRTWAWRMLKAGMPAKAVQLIGGWESMSMLERYVAMMDTEDALAMISGH
ncbi:tyrosine-type recombinase/integrase [Chloroflexota bacterium]